VPDTGATPDLGPNVLVFDPSTPQATLQARVDAVFATQQTNQFGTERYALAFKPGTYKVNINVGFYTQVLGLGASPDDVTINGRTQVDAAWFNGNATQNFWRGAENLSVAPQNGESLLWAVAQAAPFRRMHVKGSMTLDPGGGWSSGGFIADSKIDGNTGSGSQQQWMSRNAAFGSWSGGVWNMVFVGSDNAPAGNAWPGTPHTTVAQTPSVREKPFLTVGSDGRYAVVVPSVRSNSHGVSWLNDNAPPSQSIPIADFYVAKPADSTATLNAALAGGKHLLFTPGVYHLKETLKVTKANTVVLGLGLATLIPDGGVIAMQVADVDGVKIAGLLFDAGTTNSPSLLEVGSANGTADHSANPSSLHDLFFRVGGAGPGKADISLVINSRQVLGDHFWIWRADHGEGVGWTVNTTRNGLIVNGADVTLYGLFVEHFHEYQTLWNGNGGRLFFYQSEIPYDVPNQAAWMNGTANGYASYKLGSQVTSHLATGLGIYCFFQTNPQVKLGSAIEAPTTAGVQFTRMATVSLGGKGEITHVINGRGDTVKDGANNAYLAQ
jgi:hypothetical protein